jgi:hypothetical protein
MRKQSVEVVVRALNAADVRFLIAGGLAVVAHGYLRFTADMDLVLDFDDDNVRRAVTALAALGYRPRAPVPIDEFADASRRAAWVREKGLTVFSLHSPQHPVTEVDLFVETPFPDFGAAYRSALRLELAPNVVATFVSFEDLIALKQNAGRAQDLEDVDRLRTISEQRKP